MRGCTARCTADDACAGLGPTAYCSLHDVCVVRCSTGAECAAGEECFGGACNASNSAPPHAGPFDEARSPLALGARIAWSARLEACPAGLAVGSSRQGCSR